MTSVTIMHHRQKNHLQVHRDVLVILGDYDHHDGEHMTMTMIMMMTIIGTTVCVCLKAHLASVDGRPWMEEVNARLFLKPTTSEG